MSALDVIAKIVDNNNELYGYHWWCIGCDRMHQATNKWTFNGDYVKPTFTPSVLTQYSHAVPPVTSENAKEWRKNPWEQTTVHDVCHVFITDGMIDYLSDCTHKLAGQKVKMIPLKDVE